jgi:streptogramin lyase
VVAIVVAGALATPAGAVTVRIFSSGLTPGSVPTRIAPGFDGNLYFTENAANNIGRITPAGAITEFTTGVASSGPFGIAALGDGFVYYTQSNAQRVARFPSGGRSIGLTGLEEVTAGPDGNLWLTANSGNRVVQTDGVSFQAPFTPLTAASGPSGIAAGPDGNVWFTESAAHKVGRITTAGTVLPEFALTTGSGPAGIAPGPDGNMWVAEKTAGKIARITPAGVVTEFPVLPAGNNSQPTFIVAGPDGNMWFGEGNASRIGRITPSGVVTEFAAGAQPGGIAVSPDGDLWFTGGTGYIGRMNIGLRPPRYTNPEPIEVSANGGGSGPAETYPSTIEASGLSGTVSDASVRLNGVHHPNADDLEALLVGPQGQKVLLMSDSAGGGTNRDPATGQVITFDDDGVTAPAKLTNGIFKPFAGGPSPTFAGPAPSPPYATSLSAFDGTDPNGTWQLYLQDDNFGFGDGKIVGGWSLDVELTPPPVSVPGPTVQVAVPGPTVTATGPPRVVTPPADTTAPRLTLGSVAARMAQTAFRKGLAVRITPSEAVTLDVTLSVKPSRATLATAGELVLFERTVTANRATTLAVKPSARRLGRPRKAFRALLRVVATDNAGNRTTVSRIITVQPDRKRRR